MKTPHTHAFFDRVTNTVSYVVHDPDTSCACIIDPVLDFDPASGRSSTAQADEICTYMAEQGLKPLWILETHVHADHLTAAPYLKEKLGAAIAIGVHITDVQDIFGPLFNVESAFRRDGSQFDRLLSDGDEIDLGSLTIRVLHTPGHTPACLTYVIGDAAFVGDTLFMPDAGTARCDFPGGDARTLYRSIAKILALPPETRLFMCHDYGPNGRDFRWETTVGEQRASNIHVGQGMTEEEFVALREARDKTLAMPRLLLPSVQVNMRAGHFPPAEGNGTSYLKLPVNAL